MERNMLSELPPAPLPGRQRSRSRTFSEAVQDEQLPTALDPHITPHELRAEMESLLSLRRRSLSQPTSDPDLPIPTRPTLAIQTTPPPLSPPSDHPKSPTAPAAAETGTLIRRISSSVPPTRLPSDHPLPLPLAPLASPPLSSQYSPPHDGAAAAHSSQDLFWLPASLHPELAPQEFKAFIREQTRPDNLARRVSSAGEGAASGFGSGRIDRKRSTLRGEYIPGRGDGVGERATALAERRPSTGGRRSAGGLNFDELTIKDLQRLEELAARAESEGFTDGEGEGERLGRVLRRSLSLNPTHLAAAAAEGAQHSTESPTDSTDSPLVVHIPGQILRRSARTKIRKAGLVGDGGGHRFGPSRRVRPSLPPSGDEHGAESDSAGELSLDGVDLVSLDGHGSPFAVDEATQKQVEQQVPSRRSSGSDDSQEFAASVEHIEIAPDTLLVVPHSVPLPPSPISPISPITPVSVADPYPPREEVESQPDPSSAAFDWSTQQQRLLQAAPIRSRPPLSRAPDMPPPPGSNAFRQPLAPSVVPIPLPQASTIRDPKEKKSGWARLGLSSKHAEDDEGKRKKGKGKEKESEKIVEGPRRASSQSHEPVERKASGEKESSFFGGLFGKRRSDVEPNSPSPPPSAALHLAPAPPPPTASGVMGPGGRYTNFYRLPIHVERAVYRLSHIKLANSRRPLYEQVLISNLMFWYLSIINKPTPPPPVVNIVVPEENNGFQRDSGTRENAMREGGAREKRPGLKSGGRHPGRSAEQPVKQIKYEEQTRQIDQEYPPLPLSNHQSSVSSHNSSASSNSDPSSQPQHSRSNSSPPSSVHHSSSNPVPRSPDRSSAPADYYREGDRSPPRSPTKLSGSRSTGSLSDDYADQREIPTTKRSVSSSASYRENHRESQGFQVTSRSRSGEGKYSNGSGGVGEEGGYEKRPLSVRKSGDGFDEFIDAYSGRYSPPPERSRRD